MRKREKTNLPGETNDPQYYSEQIQKTVTIKRPVSDVYDFWHDFENLPQFMPHLKTVEKQDETHSHWVADGPTGKVEWDAEITSDRRNELITWRSLNNVVDHAGSVRFKETSDKSGTELTVTFAYNPLAGRFGSSLAKFFGKDPSQEIEEDLQRFKQLLEAGEIADSIKRNIR